LVEQSARDNDCESRMTPLLALKRTVILQSVVKRQRIARAAESLGKCRQQRGLTA
jgi:hypothetical protein